MSAPSRIAAVGDFVPRQDGADGHDPWSLAADPTIGIEVDRETDGVFQAVLRHRQVENLYRSGPEAGLERPVVVEVAPEGHIFAAAVRARTAGEAAAALDP